MIPITCHQCGARMEVEERYAGGTWTCGQCQAQVQVPPQTASGGILPPPPAREVVEGAQTSGKAIASLVLGLFSILSCMMFLTGVPGIILGHMAKSDIARARGRLTGKGMANWGLGLSYTGTAVFLLMILPTILFPMVERGREAVRRASCQNNLKQMALVYKMFANEARGEYWPMLSSEPGRLMVNALDIYDEYLTDPTILICPSHPHAGELHQVSDPIELIDDHTYFYLGYIVTNEAELQAFADAYRQRIDEGLPFDEDLAVPPGTGSGGGDYLLRLREGAERQISQDPTNPAASALEQSRIPVLIEPPDHHMPAGANVLYMDGHVEFIRYPGKWPMTESTINTLKDLARR